MDNSIPDFRELSPFPSSTSARCEAANSSPEADFAARHNFPICLVKEHSYRTGRGVQLHEMSRSKYSRAGSSSLLRFSFRLFTILRYEFCISTAGPGRSMPGRDHALEGLKSRLDLVRFPALNSRVLTQNLDGPDPLRLRGRFEGLLLPKRDGAVVWSESVNDSC